jgi:hypothetical protein
LSYVLGVFQEDDWRLALGVFQENDWRLAWSCHSDWEVGLIGGAPFGLGIAKSCPGKSHQGGGVVLLVNFFEIFLEFGMLCLGNIAHPHVACLVVAVNKAFGMDVPAGAHEGGVIPLGAIHRAFPCKILFPVLGDGGGIFGDAFPFGFVQLPFPPFPLLAVVPRCGVGFRQWVLGRRLDKIGGKDHIEGAVHHHLKDIVKRDQGAVDHQAAAKFLAFPQPTLDPDLRGMQFFC